ncbi:hypothetical protein [Roseibium sp.]|uniref:hypothetical protein n=1 Tax=Roseibium sp. TaxID=1936156 RepID=UPI003266CDDF
MIASDDPPVAYAGCLLFAGAVVWRKREGETYFTWWGAGLQLVPTLWMGSSILMPERSEFLTTVLTGIMRLGSLPYFGYVLLTVAVPDAMELLCNQSIFNGVQP